MSIRLTQQILQFAAAPTTESDVRVTKLFAQVAVLAGGTTIIVANASNTMLSSDPTVDTGNDFFLAISNTDLLGDSAVSPAVTGDQIGTASNTILTTGPTWTYDPVFNVFVSQQVFGGDGQTLTSNYYVAANAIFTTDPVVGYNQEVFVFQYLGFTDRKFHDTGNVLGFEDGMKVAEAEIVAANNYFWTDPDNDNAVTRAYNADVSFSGLSVDIALNTPAEVLDQLGFTDTATTTGDSDRSPANTGFLTQSLGFTISDNTCREQEYAPLVGEGRSDFEALQIATPTISDGTLTLSYPVTSPTTTLTLHDPQFGNETVLNFTRIDRDTRGGDRKLFSDAKWARWERLSFEVRDLCETTADDIIDFLNTSLGGYIKLIDWEGRGWEGVIVSPETEVTQTANGWGFAIVFEGSPTLQTLEQDSQQLTHGVDGNGTAIELNHGE